MTSETFPYSHKVAGDRLGNEDKRIVLEPNEAELARVAKAYEVDGVETLTADLTLKPWRKAGVRVVGTVDARLKRTCVVTLEPFVEELSEKIDRTFEPVSSRPRRPRDLNDEGEIEIDLETLDPPDVMIDGVLDLGAVVCEQLALVIDPFPRKPGAAFETGVAEAEEEDEPAPSPFAALAQLKDEPKS
ncbi:YceD family protein [Roseibium sp.]|uniref:YceD family protein n=1 Tax=Roseibium sp. TaxID=1936156 RepID=UPI003A96CD04